jgi:hypothetical protein
MGTAPWVLIVVFFLFGYGMGNVIAPASTVMQNVLPLARAGAGSGVQNTVRQVFGAFGVAVIGTILATQYASRSAEALAPLPPAARDVASQSVVATKVVLAQAAAHGVPPSAVATVRAGAYNAFLDSSHVTTLISFVVVLMAAAVVGFLLPTMKPPERSPADGQGEPVDVAPAVEL